MKEITWKNNISWLDWQHNKIQVDNKINNVLNIFEKPLTFEDAFENKGITKYIASVDPYKTSDISSITFNKIKETFENIHYKPTDNIPAIKTGKAGYINLVCLNLVNGLSRFKHIPEEQLNIIELEVRKALELTLPNGCYDIG